MTQKRSLFLGLTHAFSDGTAGYLVASTSSLPYETLILYVGLYNLLAFGMQPLAGWLVDTTGRPRLALQGSLGLMAAVLPLSFVSPVAAIACAGVASSCFHVSAGSLCVTDTQTVTPSGYFAAPGVMGLTLGGFCGATGVVLWPYLTACLILSAVAIHRWPEIRSAVVSTTVGMDRHEMLMIVLLFAIALRSVIWMVYQELLFGNFAELLIIAAFAMTGKFVGGHLADRFGIRMWGTLALALAGPCLAVGEMVRPLFYVGILILQSATPVGLWAMSQLLPRHPATASGLALGLAIGIGGLGRWLGVELSAMSLTMQIVVTTIAAGAMALSVRARHTVS